MVRYYRCTIELESRINELETTYKIKEDSANEYNKITAATLQKLSIENKELKKENQQLKIELKNKKEESETNNDNTKYTGNFFGDTFSSMPDEHGYDYIKQMSETAQKHKNK